jgi:hypothetical protein
MRHGCPAAAPAFRCSLDTNGSCGVHPSGQRAPVETLLTLYKLVILPLSGNKRVARCRGRWRAGTAVAGRRAGHPRRRAETNDRSAWKSLKYGAGRTARRARTLTTGGAYSHFGCRFDCPRGHCGKPHRREAAPGRGAPFGRRKAAAALARVAQGGPGPAARGRHVSRRRRTRSAPSRGADVPRRDVRAPCLFVPPQPHIDTSARTGVGATPSPSSADSIAPRATPLLRAGVCRAVRAGWTSCGCWPRNSSPACGPRPELRPSAHPPQIPLCHRLAGPAAQWRSLSPINESS